MTSKTPKTENKMKKKYHCSWGTKPSGIRARAQRLIVCCEFVMSTNNKFIFYLFILTFGSGVIGTKIGCTYVWGLDKKYLRTTDLKETFSLDVMGLTKTFKSVTLSKKVLSIRNPYRNVIVIRYVSWGQNRITQPQTNAICCGMGRNLDIISCNKFPKSILSTFSLCFIFVERK